jgi:hypothetical protein
MMSPAESPKPKATEAKQEEETIEKVSVPTDFLKRLTPVVQEYLRLKDSLVDGLTDQAADNAKTLDETLKDIDAGVLDEKAKQTWTDLSNTMKRELEKITATKELEAQRMAFDPLSEAFAKVVMGFRHVMKAPLVVFHCPMAFDSKGAYWIEASEERRNPYFGRTPFNGQDMLQCGELIEKVPPEIAKVETKAQVQMSSDDKSAENPGRSEPKSADQAQGSQSESHESHQDSPDKGTKGEK